MDFRYLQVAIDFMLLIAIILQQRSIRRMKRTITFLRVETLKIRRGET